MFKKTRRKIVLIITAAIILVLIFTLMGFYLSSYISMKKRNSEMLGRYVSEYSIDNPPGKHPPEENPPRPEGNGRHKMDGLIYKLSAFFSAAISDDGKVLAVDTGRVGFVSEEDVIKMADKILKENKKTGTFRTLLYRVEDRDGYVLVAYIETAIADDILNYMLLNNLIAGAILAGILIIAAIFMAKIIIRPLEENDIRQKQFVSDAGHELKTPISVISTNSELLSRQIGENEWLANIQYENERMGSLVKELLDLSIADHVTEFEKVDFSKVVVKEVLPFESLAFEHGLTIKSSIAEDVFVNGDANWLGHLVSILTDNAINHSYDGSEEIIIELKKEHRYVVLSVTNDGKEIPKDVRDHIFERFFKIDRTGESSEGHYGLGLSIAREIVTLHKGKIKVDCPDEKIVFSVYIPLEK